MARMVLTVQLSVKKHQRTAQGEADFLSGFDKNAFSLMGNHQLLLDQVRNRSANRGATSLKLLTQVKLTGEPISRRLFPGLNLFFELLRNCHMPGSPTRTLLTKSHRRRRWRHLRYRHRHTNRYMNPIRLSIQPILGKITALGRY